MTGRDKINKIPYDDICPICGGKQEPFDYCCDYDYRITESTAYNTKTGKSIGDFVYCKRCGNVRILLKGEIEDAEQNTTT